MGVSHIFDAVSDELARRQRIEHAVVAHGDAVVDRDGVEFLCDPARGLHLPRHQLPKVLEMHVAGHELSEGIGYGDDRLAEIAVFMPVARQRPRAPAMLRPWVEVRERYGGMVGLWCGLGGA